MELLVRDLPALVTAHNLELETLAIQGFVDDQAIDLWLTERSCHARILMGLCLTLLQNSVNQGLLQPTPDGGNFCLQLYQVLDQTPSPLDAFIAPQETLKELLNRVGVNSVGDVKRKLEEEVKMVEDNYSLIKRVPSSIVRSL